MKSLLSIFSLTFLISFCLCSFKTWGQIDFTLCQSSPTGSSTQWDVPTNGNEHMYFSSSECIDLTDFPGGHGAFGHFDYHPDNGIAIQWGTIQTTSNTWFDAGDGLRLYIGVTAPTGALGALVLKNDSEGPIEGWFGLNGIWYYHFVDGVWGCTDPGFCSFDPAATIPTQCPENHGCTDTDACNFDLEATCDDGSCLIPSNIDYWNYGCQWNCENNQVFWSRDCGCGITDLDGDGICDSYDYELTLNPTIIEEFQESLVVSTSNGLEVVTYLLPWSYLNRLLPDGATIILESGYYEEIQFGYAYNDWYALPGSWHGSTLEGFFPTGQDYDTYRTHLTVKAADSHEVFVNDILLSGNLTDRHSYTFENLNITGQFKNQAIGNNTSYNTEVIGCTFSGNSGSAMHLESSVYVRDCTFEYCAVGINFHSLSILHQTIIENCSFAHCWYALRRSLWHTGSAGSPTSEGQPNINNCTFTDNSIASLQLPTVVAGSSYQIDLHFNSCDFINNYYVHVNAMPAGSTETNTWNQYDNYNSCYFEGNYKGFSIHEHYGSPSLYPDGWFWDGNGWPTDWDEVTTFARPVDEDARLRYGIQNNCFFYNNGNLGCTENATNCLFVSNESCHGAIREWGCAHNCAYGGYVGDTEATLSGNIYYGNQLIWKYNFLEQQPEDSGCWPNPIDPNCENWPFELNLSNCALFWNEQFFQRDEGVPAPPGTIPLNIDGSSFFCSNGVSADIDLVDNISGAVLESGCSENYGCLSCDSDNNGFWDASDDPQIPDHFRGVMEQEYGRNNVKPLWGCGWSSACNYDPDLSGALNDGTWLNDGTCVLDPPEGFCDCDGNQLDALGVCGGACASDVDNDGICDDLDDCVGAYDDCGVCNGPGATYECGCADIPEGDCDCNGNQQLDALGECGGDCAADADSDGICDDVDDCVGAYDDCSVCNGPGQIYECGCADIPEGDCDCDGNVLDAIGVCGGSCSADADSDGICDDVDDCVGAYDDCSVCNGPGAIYECGCADIPEGDCDCDGNVLDALGVCGGACAADADSDGICDDVDDCVGAYDDCGVCNGPGAIYECGCADIPEGDCDCDGNVLDALGVCGGACAADADSDGICDDVDDCVGTYDDCGVCNGPGAIYECGCTDIPDGDCDCDGNQEDVLGVCGGDCSADLDSDGVCDDVDDCVGAYDACGVCNGPGSIYECGCADIPEGDCDCDGNQPDALGVCDGACTADADSDGICDDVDDCVGTYDACGVCNGPGSIYECGCADIPEGYCDCDGNELDALGVCGGDCEADADVDGICDDVDDCVGAYDECGICNGPGAIYECGCADIPEGDCDCDGNQLDALGVCDGACTADADSDGICDDVDDCVGTYDDCGVCNGPGAIYECGCTDIPDGDCDCDGNQEDVLGVCGGDCSADLDSDGVCDDVDDCVGAYDACGVCNGPGSIYECGCADIPEGDCDCDGNQLDALGVCDGACTADADSDGICDDVDDCVGTYDACGVCNGPGSIYECGCADIPEGDCDCDGNQLDALGVCDGACTADADSDGICDDVDDCVGTYDACGVCNGPGAIYECGCADIPEGDCDCDGNQEDVLGVCGGDCSADLDSDGVCDDVDDCVGAYDECGICNGPGAIYECGCADIPEGDCDCDGNQLDAIGVCGGDCAADADVDGVCDDVDDCVGAYDECGICNGPGAIYECGCADIPEGDCDCDGNQLDALGVCDGACTADADSDGICDDVDDCVGAYDECGICNGPGAIYECGCADIPEGDCDCDGNQEEDVLGVCGGDCSADLDSDGVCDDVDDCVGAYDECGICNGPGAIYECGCNHIPSGNCDCDGNQLDALGVCGGDCSADLDSDGICDDADDCVGTYDDCGICNGPGAIFDCGCNHIPSGNCDCDGNQLDALGVCGGDCSADLDSDGICDDADDCVGTYDDCGICNGPGAIFDCGCNHIPSGDCNCDGNQLDALGVCGGDCSADLDSDGICDDVDDCFGAYDECGVCNGPGAIYECGCTDIPDGDCDCEGNQFGTSGIPSEPCDLDENTFYLNGSELWYNISSPIYSYQLSSDGSITFTDAFGGDTELYNFNIFTYNSGVMAFHWSGGVIPAGCGILTNLVVSGDITDFTTGLSWVFGDELGNEINVNYFEIISFCDCEGNALDAVGICGGTCPEDTDSDGLCDDIDPCVGIYDACLVCNGPGSIYECGCSGIPESDCDCDGSELDALGVCGGDCFTDVDGDGICDDVDGCVGTIDACGVCNGPGEIYACGCELIPAGNCDCNGNQLDALGVCGGSCAADADSDGICDDVDDCIGALDACGICMGDGMSCLGCTYNTAMNYNSSASIDDESCIFEDCDLEAAYDAGVASVECPECDPNAGYEDGYSDGVESVDITSDNQDAFDAGVASVVCPDGGSSCPGDLDNDGAVATSDLLMFLSAFGGTCTIAAVPGCMDDTSCNFNSEATEDDGSCYDCVPCGDLVSHEGYDYSTVQIGDQCWFSENCRYLPEVSPSSEGSESAPYYYVYDYQGSDVTAAQATDNYATYGVLYNWPAVMTEGICPSGWHIPSDGEWQTMEISLGMSEAEAAGTDWRGTDEGYQIKSTSGWNDGGNGSNSSGFNGLSGGYRYSGGFGYPGDYGYWWSASESGSYSWNRVLFNGYDSVSREGSLSRNHGFSARCVRDD